MKNLICLLVIAGCSSEGAQVNITKSVGAEGGTVSNNDGTSIIIPMGALAMSSNITITSVNAAAPTGTVLVGPAYDFGPEGTNFSQAVTITLPFDAARIPAGKTSNDILIYTAPRGSTNYLALQTTVAGNTVVTSTTHFTTYLPAVTTGGGGFDMSLGGNCTPSCTASANSCGCSASCGGHSYTMSCSQSGTAGPASCFCEIDSMTQSTSIVLDSCSPTQAQSAFQSQCLPAA